MVTVSTLTNYLDDNGNEIITSRTFDSQVQVRFRGHNNRIVIADDARLGRLNVTFDCDHGTLEIGNNTKVGPSKWSMRLGQNSTIQIGDNVSTTETCVISAVEGVKVQIGDDVMIAEGVQIRADDGHPIFDVASGIRVNMPRQISIGNHVWLGFRAAVLGGAQIGDGTVVGLGSIVTGRIPDNCVAAGSPARVIRRNVAWHLSLVKPYFKPDSSTVAKSEYWHLTENWDVDTKPVKSKAGPVLEWLRARFRRI